MSHFKQNVIANLAGRLATAALGLLLVPVIVKIMGIEAYGLVSFFATVQAIFSVLDLGLSATINRELARVTAAGEPPEALRDLVRTLETCYWGVALAIGGAMLAMTPAIERWVQPQHLTRADVHQAVLMMCGVVALQWPLSFYEGGLMGLQRQVTSNAIGVAMAVVRQAGAVAVLLLVSPTVQTFVLWQAITSGLQTGVTAAALWWVLPRSAERPRIRRAVVERVWRFAAGLTGTSLVTLGLTHLDRAVLSRVLPLDQFGYYALAAVAAGGLHYLIGPFYAAAFPRFSELVVLGDESALREEYHRAAQFVSAVVLPAALVLIVFAPEVMRLWTHNPETAARTSAIVAILAAGTAMNGLVHMPYALQLASGWPTLTLAVNSVALCILAPATFVVARTSGGFGVAWLWLALNAAYVCVTVPLMHRRLLRGELWRWYRVDVGAPLAGAAAGVALGRLALPPDLAPWTLAACLAVVSAVTLALAALAAPATRTAIGRLVARGDSAVAVR